MLFPLYDLNPTARTPFVTLGLIAINTIALVLMWAVPEDVHDDLVYGYGFLPIRVQQLAADQVVRIEPPRQEFVNVPQGPAPQARVIEPDAAQLAVSLLTAMFLHGGIVHLVGNMWYLWIFGNNIEDRLGHVPFLLFYLLGGIFASAAHWAMTTVFFPAALGTPTIGASGAVAVVLGAYLVMYPLARVRTLVFIFFFITFIELPAFVLLGFWILGQLISAFGELSVLSENITLSGGIAWWAHIGGFAFGALLMPLLARFFPDPRGPIYDEFGEPHAASEYYGYGRRPEEWEEEYSPRQSHGRGIYWDERRDRP